MKKRSLAIVGLVLLLAMAACGGDDETDEGDAQPTPVEATDAGLETPAEEEAPPAGGELTVAARDNFFEPASLAVPANEAKVTVTFVNQGEVSHTFTAEGVFDSGAVKPGDSKEVSFASPQDVVNFMCSIHGASMAGQITLE